MARSLVPASVRRHWNKPGERLFFALFGVLVFGFGGYFAGEAIANAMNLNSAEVTTIKWVTVVMLPLIWIAIVARKWRMPAITLPTYLAIIGAFGGAAISHIVGAHQWSEIILTTATAMFGGILGYGLVKLAPHRMARPRTHLTGRSFWIVMGALIALGAIILGFALGNAYGGLSAPSKALTGSSSSSSPSASPSATASPSASPSASASGRQTTGQSPTKVTYYVLTNGNYGPALTGTTAKAQLSSLQARYSHDPAVTVADAQALHISGYGSLTNAQLRAKAQSLIKDKTAWHALIVTLDSRENADLNGHPTLNGKYTHGYMVKQGTNVPLLKTSSVISGSTQVLAFAVGSSTYYLITSTGGEPRIQYVAIAAASSTPVVNPSTIPNTGPVSAVIAAVSKNCTVHVHYFALSNHNFGPALPGATAMDKLHVAWSRYCQDPLLTVADATAMHIHGYTNLTDAQQQAKAESFLKDKAAWLALVKALVKKQYSAKSITLTTLTGLYRTQYMVRNKHGMPTIHTVVMVSTAQVIQFAWSNGDVLYLQVPCGAQPRVQIVAPIVVPQPAPSCTNGSSGPFPQCPLPKPPPPHCTNGSHGPFPRCPLPPPHCVPSASNNWCQPKPPTCVPSASNNWCQPKPPTCVPSASNNWCQPKPPPCQPSASNNWCGNPPPCQPSASNNWCGNPPPCQPSASNNWCGNPPPCQWGCSSTTQVQQPVQQNTYVTTADVQPTAGASASQPTTTIAPPSNAGTTNAAPNPSTTTGYDSGNSNGSGTASGSSTTTSGTTVSTTSQTTAPSTNMPGGNAANVAGATVGVPG